MPRSISSSITAACVAAAIAGAFAQPAVAAGNRESIERGRSTARGVLIVGDPRACGVALLRARCIADVEVFLHGRGDGDFGHVPNVGKHPASGLRAFVTNGDRDAFDTALRWINNEQSSEKMWNDDPRDAALFDAGIEDVFLPAAPPGAIMERLGMVPVGDLANHASRIPPGTLPLDIAPIRDGARGPSGVMRLPPGGPKFAHDLVAALDTAEPPNPLATMPYADTPAGDAALGIAAAAVRELAASRRWLAQADVQRFVDEYLARLRALAPDRASEMDDVRATLRGDAAFDANAAQAAHFKVLGAILGNGTIRGERASIAFAVAQISYNAMIDRDAKIAEVLLRTTSSATALDEIPGYAAARAEAAAIAPSDWLAQYRLGIRLTDVLMKGGSR